MEINPSFTHPDVGLISLSLLLTSHLKRLLKSLDWSETLKSQIISESYLVEPIKV